MMKKTTKNNKMAKSKSKSIKRIKSNKTKKRTNLNGGKSNISKYARLEQYKQNQSIKCLQCQQINFVMESDLLESSRWTSVFNVSAFTNTTVYILTCVACKYMMWFREKPKNM